MIGPGYKMTKKELAPIIAAIERDLMSATANERKARERKAKRDAGLVRLELWVPPQIVQQLKTLAEAQTRQYLLTLEALPKDTTKP